MHAQCPNDDYWDELGCLVQHLHYPHKPLINQATSILIIKEKGWRVEIEIKHIGEIRFSIGSVLGLAADNQCFLHPSVLFLSIDWLLESF